MRFDVRDQRLPGTGTLVRDYIPERPSLAALLWVHGGAFAGGSIEMPESDAVARELAAAGRRVRTVDYRLAPDFSTDEPLRPDPARGRYPAAQDDVLSALSDLADDGMTFLGGASAGACIAASAAIRLRDEGSPPPLGLLLVYGVFHAELPEHTDAEGQRLAGITDPPARRWVATMARNYAGSEELLSHAHVFPGAGDVAALPATLILDAENDVLRASGKRFAAQLRDAAVPTTEIVVAGSGHGFLNDPTNPHFTRGTAELMRWMHLLSGK